MSYINITFRKSVKKDFDTLYAFIKDAKYDDGRNLNWAVFKKYPQLKIYFNKEQHYKITNEKILRSFINKIYRSQSVEMERALVQHKKNWEKISADYFLLIDTF